VRSAATAPAAERFTATARSVAARSVAARPAAVLPTAVQARMTRVMAGEPADAGAATGHTARTAAPVRLTRRGRIVVSTLVVTVVSMAVLLVLLLASGGAQATNHGRPGGAYQGMRQVVVQPGQTLWSIAAAAEPSADPRSVIQEIVSVNDLNGTNIAVGTELWVPR
jgi:hypothetical protein